MSVKQGFIKLWHDQVRIILDNRDARGLVIVTEWG